MRLPALAVAALLMGAGLPAGGCGAVEVAAPAATTGTIVAAVTRTWFQAEWRSYAARFMTPEGRIADNANGGISHSEGQGYGLLLAARADDAERFATLWRWTSTHLMVRADGLAAWRWDPAARAVTDTNNASDGDMLIAWALWDAARRFGRPDYRQAAERLARAIGAEVVRPTRSGPILLPGQKGFGAGEQPDGPVINLSYWVFPAFPALKDLAPDTDWDGLRRHGLAILDASRFGPYSLPTEWESLAGPAPRPAKSFPAAFGYNAIRIPLYLALDDGEGARKALHRFTGAWTQPGATAARVTDIKAVAITPPLAAPGYDSVLALAGCVATGAAIAPESLSTRSDLYFPETLRLLSVVALQDRFPACL